MNTLPAFRTAYASPFLNLAGCTLGWAVAEFSGKESAGHIWRKLLKVPCCPMRCFELFVLGLLGCVPALGQTNPTLRITSDPPVADVEINGIIVGQTPYEVEIPTSYLRKPKTVFGTRLDHPVHLRLWLQGYVTADADLADGPMHFRPINGVSHGDYYLLKADHFHFDLEPSNTPPATAGAVSASGEPPQTSTSPDSSATSSSGHMATSRRDVEILSDTNGVDFGPYVRSVRGSVKKNWYLLIPKKQRHEEGDVTIRFAIMKDGHVADMQMSQSSGHTALDQAAWNGITISSPFSPLPTDFHGPFLSLRFHFYYNEKPEEVANPFYPRLPKPETPSSDKPQLDSITAPPLAGVNIFSLVPATKDVQDKLSERIGTDRNATGDLQRDVATLTTLLHSGNLNKIGETTARYYRGAARAKLNAILDHQGEAIDFAMAEEALEDFDKVIASGVDVPPGVVSAVGAEYLAGGVARNQIRSDTRAYSYYQKCAEQGHGGCVNVMASAHVTGAGNTKVDLQEALRLHHDVFDTGIKYRCAGALSARSIAKIVYFTGVRWPGDDELAWASRSYSLSDQIEVGEKRKNSCNGSEARLEEFLYRLSRGERKDGLLEQASARLDADSLATNAVIQYFSGAIDETAFEAGVSSSKSEGDRCSAYFEAMWYEELAQKPELAKRFHEQLVKTGQLHCRTELVYANKFKF
jgi:TonB family protein